MNLDQDPSRLRQLEQKVDNLTWMVGIQTVLLSFLALVYVLKFSRYVIFFLLIAIPLLYVFRRSLPQLTKLISAWWFRRERGQVEARQGPS